MVLRRLFGRRRPPAGLRQRLELLRSPPTFSLVVPRGAATPDLVYPDVETVPDLAQATHEFVGFVAPGDTLTPDALLAMAEAVAGRTDADLVYSDEVGPDGDTFHKPGWSPELLLAQPYVLRFAAYRRELVLAVGGERATAGGSRDYDLALRVAEAARQVIHVPRVLCRVGRNRIPLDTDLRVAADAAARRGLAAVVTRSPAAHVHAVSLEPRQRPPVTVIVPTRDRLDLLRPCVQSLLAKTSYPDLRLTIVDNGSRLPETIAQLQAWQRQPRVRVLPDPAPFDYSALMNRAVRAADTPLVVLLNNDTEVIAPRWLDEMVGWIEQPGVGAVGAKLYYGNDTIQHAGIVLGIGGVASHGHKGLPRHAPGYHGLLHSVRDVSAVTGACMLTRRDVFVQLGGFDETLPVAYNDVDYCLRLRQHGHRVLFAPLAELYHHEGQSRGDDRRGAQRFDRAIALMQARWGEALRQDPFYNPCLSLQATDYRRR